MTTTSRSDFLYSLIQLKFVHTLELYLYCKARIDEAGFQDELCYLWHKRNVRIAWKNYNRT